MGKVTRKLAFVLAASDHGTMIVNRFDYRMMGQYSGIGVGYQILERGSFDPSEVDLAMSILDLRRKYFGDGVLAIDCGANIGVHTIEWAKRMTGWGHVIAVEAQERLFYALAGNIAINNCFNAKAVLAAAAAQMGVMKIPQVDYVTPSSFGSLELTKRERTEFIGQPIDYSKESAAVPAVTLDSLELRRADLIKIDVEGMELDVLEGAVNIVEHSHPALIVEFIKSDKAGLRAWFERFDYQIFESGINFLAVHKSDKTATHIRIAS
jgi:FkbM family methyltransferase